MRFKQFFYQSLIALVSAVVIQSSGAGPQSVAAQAGDSDYLPLAVGNRWELSSSVTRTPMVFEVLDRDGDEYVVRWDNPWIAARFRFIKSGNRVVLAGLDMGAGNAPMPPGTVYFDFAARQGASWTNGIGKMTVVARNLRVTTPSGTYDNAIQIRATDRQGADTLWTFAPNVGFVQFGEGNSAFRLASFRTGRGQPERTTERTPPPAAPRGRSGSGPGEDDRVLIGIDFNPTPPEGFEEPAKRAAFKRAIDAGLAVMNATPTWYSLEPRPGEYNLKDVDFSVSLAEEYNVPIYLNVRVIDTGNKSVPGAYAKLAFDDPQLGEALERLLQQVGRRTRNRVRWIAIGNEVDSHLKSRDADIPRYARMLESVRDTVTRAFPNAQLTVNFTIAAAGDLSGKYRAISDRLDFVSFTYYPLNFNFTMKDPSGAAHDIKTMVDAAGQRQLFIQEVGYASAERLKSSPEKQAQFYRNVFTALETYGERTIAANFLFMSDLPEATVQELGGYYRVPLFKENFKAYIRTLGLFDQQGRPKPAWDVFRQNAPRLSRSTRGRR